MSLTEASIGVEADEQVVLRLVVYGPASAGKTTTARALGDNLGRPVETPEEEEDGTTVFFDWMEFEGGTFQGSAVRIQLVTVPGHDRNRRLALLDVADVIIFVADTTEAGIDTSTEYFQEMTEELRSLKRDPAILVQANKRDDSTAVPVDVLRGRFGMRPGDPLVETVATSGNGVRLVFVLAMRNGLERHAARIARGEIASRLDPNALLEALRAVESSVPDPDTEFDTDTGFDDSGFDDTGLDGAEFDAEAALVPGPESAELMPPPPTLADAVTRKSQQATPRQSWLRRMFGNP